MLREVLDNGHEIGSHSVTHHPVTLKMPEQAEREAWESRRMIEDWIGKKFISSFCYPFYWSHEYLAAAVKQAGYGQARGGGALPEYGPRASYYAFSKGGLDKFNVDCRQIAREGENVSGWLREGCWHVLTYHGVGTDEDGWEPLTVAEFAAQMEELANHRDSGACEVVTFKDGAARFAAPVG